MQSKSKRNGLIILIVFAFILINTVASFAETINYSYDNILRLIRTGYNDGTVEDYVYDNMGNRLQKATNLTGVPTNNPPNSATNPNPQNGATEVSTTPTLSWTGGDPDAGDEVVYYIYFGTSANPPLVSSGGQVSYAPGQLNSLTTYYWKVVSRDSHNADTESPVWSFTTRNDPPIASFTVDQTEGWPPLTVRFTDTSSSPDDEIVSWSWDFDNDGIIDSTLQNPTHTYTVGGVYTISLTVTDIYGATDTETKVAFIAVCSDSGIPPVANPGGPYSGVEGQEMILDGSGSSGPGGRIVGYEWDVDNDGMFEAITSLPTQTYVYSQQGIYTINLRVTDICGMTGESTTTATISDTLPVVDFTGYPTSGLAALEVWFADNSTGYDQPLLYEWDFNNDGVIDSTDPYPMHIYSNGGVYTVKLTVTDSDGSVSTLTRTDYITVSYPPIRILRAIPIYYSTLWEAYDAAIDGDIIQVQDVQLIEDIYISLDKTVVIDGGYNSDYSAKTGKTRLKGEMTISNGRVTLGDFIIEQ